MRSYTEQKLNFHFVWLIKSIVSTLADDYRDYVHDVELTVLDHLTMWIFTNRLLAKFYNMMHIMMNYKLHIFVQPNCHTFSCKKCIPPIVTVNKMVLLQTVRKLSHRYIYHRLNHFILTWKYLIIIDQIGLFSLFYLFILRHKVTYAK